MSWRDRLVKALVDQFGKRTDLSMDVYHGTRKVFPEFKEWPVKEAYTIDRALGTHVAPDPALSSSFAGTGSDYHMSRPFDPAWKEQPHVIPLKAPPDEAFLRADQPVVSEGRATSPLWRQVRTDTRAIENMAGLEAFLRDPDLLTKHLERSRAMPPPDARAISRALVAGESPTFDGAPRDLRNLLNNYGPPVGDDMKQRVVDLAKDSWQKQGHAGIKYINTAPMEAGAPGVKDPTSYLVFDPADLRSRWAQFDPAMIKSRNLMSGVAGAAALGGLAAQDQYEVQR